MKKLFLVSLLSFISLLSAGITQASSISDIEFPVPELGNCESQEACKAYCDDSAHLDECVRFGERHGLIGKDEVQKAKDFSGQTGPGGCRGANECRAYCEDSNHQRECVEFGNRKGLISDQRAEAALEVLDQGGPGGCQSENECRTYCEDPGHIDECLAFAEKHGFVNKEDAARIKKAGFTTGPGGCRGANECRAYCEDPAHNSECIDFAVENGFMSREDAERAKKFAGKTGPGGCRGEECREFCENPTNTESCLEFAVKEGLIPPQELERARKFLRVSQEGGPGGCKGEECRDYCEDSAHQDECFEFAKKQGIIKPEEEKQFEVGKKIRQKMQETGGPGGCKTEEECHTYCSDAGRVEECVAFGAAHGGIPDGEVRQMLKDFQEHRFEARGGFRPPEEFRRFEEEGQKRFQEFRALEEQFRGGPQGGGFPGGPGFSDFGRDQGQGGGFGPGGCTSPTECIRYCSEHKEECFQSGQHGQTPGRESDAPGRGFGVPPQLRGNLIIQFDDKLPEGFEQKSEEERRVFFQQKFNEVHGTNQLPGRPGEFPGRPGQFEGSRQFPGRPGEFPGHQGQFEGSRDLPASRQGFPGQPFGGQGESNFPGRPEQFPGQFPREGNFPEGFQPDPGTFPRPPEGILREPTRVDQLFQPQSLETAPPPTGTFFNGPPPGETFQPPPPSAETQTAPSLPPPSSEPVPQPSSAAPLDSFFGAILKAFLGTQ